MAKYQMIKEKFMWTKGNDNRGHYGRGWVYNPDGSIEREKPQGWVWELEGAVYYADQ